MSDIWKLLCIKKGGWTRLRTCWTGPLFNLNQKSAKRCQIVIVQNFPKVCSAPPRITCDSSLVARAREKSPRRALNILGSVPNFVARPFARGRTVARQGHSFSSSLKPGRPVQLDLGQNCEANRSGPQPTWGDPAFVCDEHLACLFKRGSSGNEESTARNCSKFPQGLLCTAPDHLWLITGGKSKRKKPQASAEYLGLCPKFRCPPIRPWSDCCSTRALFLELTQARPTGSAWSWAELRGESIRPIADSTVANAKCNFSKICWLLTLNLISWKSQLSSFYEQKYYCFYSLTFKSTTHMLSETICCTCCIRYVLDIFSLPRLYIDIIQLFFFSISLICYFLNRLQWLMFYIQSWFASFQELV